MIVPVLRTTGVNTKILVALELGIPLVITPQAASPFDLPENETVVAFADQALDFVQQTVSVYTVSWLWTQMARASRQVTGCATTTATAATASTTATSTSPPPPSPLQHWENLATHDPARSDVRNMASPARIVSVLPSLMTSLAGSQ